MSLADEATQAGLHRVGARPPLFAYLGEVWRRRQFIYRLARYRIESSNAQNRLGMAWVILKPTIDAVVYGTVFGIFLMRGNIPHHYIVFLVVGVFMFDYFSSCFNSGSKSITKNAHLVQSLSFPRMALPLALVVQQLLEFVPMLAIIYGVVLAYGVLPRFDWLMMVPVVVLFTIFNAGIAMITARLTVHFQDLTQILPFVSRILFYTSGVFYSMELAFSYNQTLLHILEFQPTHEFLSLGRSVLLHEPGFTVGPEYWVYASIWAFVSIVFGTIFFWSAEELYGRVD